MDWRELILASRLLASGQASQESLRRAVSTAYYAMFHALATSNADLIVGPKTAANQEDWARTYRSLQHIRAQNPLHGWPHLFPFSIQNFAHTIGSLKVEREDADYNPNINLVRDQVVTLIDIAHRAILDFDSASPSERAMVAIATQRGEGDRNRNSARADRVTRDPSAIPQHTASEGAATDGRSCTGAN